MGKLPTNSTMAANLASSPIVVVVFVQCGKTRLGNTMTLESVLARVTTIHGKLLAENTL